MIMFASRRRKPVLVTLITVGALAIVALMLPSGGGQAQTDISVAPGHLAVPLNIRDTALVEILTTRDRLDVMATRHLGDQPPVVRRLATNVRVLATLKSDSARMNSGREMSTVVVEASPSAALAIAGAINDSISVAILPK